MCVHTTEPVTTDIQPILTLLQLQPHPTTVMSSLDLHADSLHELVWEVLNERPPDPVDDESKLINHEIDVPSGVSVILKSSDIGARVQDRSKTAYVFEGQFRVLQPDSLHRYMATCGVLNCITIIVNVPEGVSLMAHVTLSSVYYSLDEATFMKRGGGALQNMVDKLRDSFHGVDTSMLVVSLVGGWSLSDVCVKLKSTYFPENPVLWTFSGVLRDCVQRAFPGVKIDVSRLNMFQGVSWSARSFKTKLHAVANGHTFRMVVLDTWTGVVETQQTDITDLTGDDSVSVRVPESVVMESLVQQDAMHARITLLDQTWPHGCIPPSVLEEYIPKCPCDESDR